MKRLISIVAPAYNEALVLPLLCRALFSTIDRIAKYQFEMIIVENGSTDSSLDILLKERAKDKRIKILQLARNVGCDNGIMAGLSYARGDAAIIMNADLQDDPQLIPKFIKKWEYGYDMVYAIIRSRIGMSQTQQSLIHILYKGLRLLTLGRIPENVSDYRLLDRFLYSQILKRRHQCMFFRVAAAMMSRNAIGITYDRPQRESGTSKMTITDYLIDIRNAVITLIMCIKPLREITISMRNDPPYVIKHRYGLSEK